MKAYLECIPCFFRQALEGARNAKLPLRDQKRIMDKFAMLIPKISLKLTPPEIARMGYALLETGRRGFDPYKKIKKKSNILALKLLSKLKKKVSNSKDKLLAAIELAIAGNIIDFGVKNNLDINQELKKIISGKKGFADKKSLFHYSEFKSLLRKSRNILYLADNAGEVVFDRILIEEIKREFPDKNLYFAVKEKPIINDALLEDARFCGIEESAKIISNGTNAPGTILKLCAEGFKKIYKNADMVISKGQGNFESLSGESKEIFFLFMVKCPVVAAETRCKMGSIVLLYNLKDEINYKKHSLCN